jgi:hypothetical protein
MDNNVIGRDSKIIFEFSVDEIPSKIDTGAETNSIHCGDTFIDNGVLYSDVLETGNLIPFTNYEIKRVRSSNGKLDKRYCINLNFILGDKKYNSDFTLNNRGLMKYPVLLGKNFLRDNSFMVDVSQSINERLLNNFIKKILNEENEKIHLYNKIANVLKPPYIFDLENNFDLNYDDIIPIMELILNEKINTNNSQYGVGGDTYLLNVNNSLIYYEEFDGSDWVIRKFDKNKNLVGYTDIEGEWYIDKDGNAIKL